MGVANEEPRRAVAGSLLPGMSAADFQEVLAALLGKDAPNLSPAVITRLTAQWQADYGARLAEARPLSAAIRVRVGRWGLSQARMDQLASLIRAFLPQRSGGGGRRRAAVHVQYGSSNKLE